MLLMARHLFYRYITQSVLTLSFNYNDLAGRYTNYVINLKRFRYKHLKSI